MTKRSVPKAGPTEIKQIPDVELISIDLLKPHPRNYRQHGEDQLAHIISSVKANGCYRNIVIADDYTILAGHGVVQGCKIVGLKEVPCVKLPFGPEDARALTVLTGDNEISRLGTVDDRMLTEILKDINKQTNELMGTGFDPMQFANLVMITRHSDEIGDLNEAAQWVGMPAFSNVPSPLKLIISFENEDARNELLKRMKIKELSKASGKTFSMWWPQRERQDLKSVEFKSKK